MWQIQSYQRTDNLRCIARFCEMALRDDDCSAAPHLHVLYRRVLEIPPTQVLTPVEAALLVYDTRVRQSYSVVREGLERDLWKKMGRALNGASVLAFLEAERDPGRRRRRFRRNVWTYPFPGAPERFLPQLTHFRWLVDSGLRDEVEIIGDLLGLWEGFLDDKVARHFPGVPKTYEWGVKVRAVFGDCVEISHWKPTSDPITQLFRHHLSVWVGDNRLTLNLPTGEQPAELVCYSSQAPRVVSVPL